MPPFVAYGRKSIIVRSNRDVELKIEADNICARLHLTRDRYLLFRWINNTPCLPFDFQGIVNHRQRKNRLLFLKIACLSSREIYIWYFIFKNRDEISRDNLLHSFYQHQLRATRKRVAVVASSCVHFTSMDSSGAKWCKVVKRAILNLSVVLIFLLLLIISYIIISSVRILRKRMKILINFKLCVNAFVNLSF